VYITGHYIVFDDKCLLMKKQVFMDYDWRVVVVEKFLILHYIEEASSKLVIYECLFNYDSCYTSRCH